MSVRWLVCGVVAASLIAASIRPAAAFCGFYVGKADAGLFNQASQVILVRDGNRTVISMLNDYKGALDEFALVVPVPQVLQREQIHVGDKKLFERIDAYSAPRLAEYHDDDPCMRRQLEMDRQLKAVAPASVAMDQESVRRRGLGVTVEASYQIGEYDILILGATQSDGLEAWLLQNGYRIPKNASRALKPYIRQKMKFFVAKVNLKEQSRTGLSFLRPLQFAFESEKFMLPLRLGMVNGTGAQDLIAYVMTRNGRVESTNYRTVKLPANMDVPVYIRDDFTRFYKAMFEHQARAEDYRVVFTEYFWDMSWCDPCAADPLSPDEIRAAGVFWLGEDAQRGRGGSPVMLTRLHVRYTPDTFPEDLMFQETSDRGNFQARYVLRHAWPGSADACPEAKLYFERVAQRQTKEAQVLAELTGWDLNRIRSKMELQPVARQEWWRGLWR
jgi:hypothetical protein